MIGRVDATEAVAEFGIGALEAALPTGLLVRGMRRGPEDHTKGLGVDGPVHKEDRSRDAALRVGGGCCVGGATAGRGGEVVCGGFGVAEGWVVG